MCLVLNQTVEDLAGWSEGCACHPPGPRLDPLGRLDLNSPARVASLGGGGSCPMKSLRAPEMASGEWKRTMEQLFQLSTDQLMRQHRPLLKRGLAVILVPDVKQCFAVSGECIFCFLCCFQVNAQMNSR